MNNKEKTFESLAALAENINEKSDVAKLREVFGYVEMALSSGVSREKVLETIRTTLGIKMNLKTFENNLYRIRKKQKSGKLAEMPRTNEEINSGSQQLIDISTIVSKPNVTDKESSKKFISPGSVIPGVTVTPPACAMQAFPVTKQHDAVPADEDNQDSDDDELGESYSPRPIKDFFVSEEEYQKKCIRWKKELDEKKCLEKEKEMVDFEEK